MTKQILVVDDSPIVRNIHAFMLKSEGFAVEEASNGYEAIEKLFDFTFDESSEAIKNVFFGLCSSSEVK